MRTKNKGAKMLKVTQGDAEKVQSPESLDLFDVSSIERASILDGPHKSYGNPLHSTAIEEHLGLLEENDKDGGKGEKKGGRGGRKVPVKPTAAKQRLTVSPRKEEDAGKAVKRVRKRRSVGAGQQSTRPVKEQGPGKEKKRGRTLANRKSQTPSSSRKRQRPRESSSSSSPSGSSADNKQGPQKLARKISSESGAASDVTQADVQRGRSRGQQGKGKSLVLDSFLTLCDSYKESVESTTVRKAIDMFSSTFEERLTETITSSKELRVLKRDNAKVDSLIRRKRNKLFDAKYELVRAEKRLRLLQKEKAELALRLADLRKSQTFLRGIGDLSRRYLAHRRAHPAEKEQYGASSLPALLMETKCILGTEHQLQIINDRLAARLEKK